jgi:hypothetical protein
VLNSRYAPGATGVFTLNSTTILEANWGMNYDNQLNPLVTTTTQTGATSNSAISRYCSRRRASFPWVLGRASSRDRVAVLHQRRGVDDSGFHLGQPDR